MISSIAFAASPLSYVDRGKSFTRGEAELLTEAALEAVRRNDRERAEQFVTYSLEFGETAQAHDILGELRQARGDEAGAIEAWQTALGDDKHPGWMTVDEVRSLEDLEPMAQQDDSETRRSRAVP